MSITNTPRPFASKKSPASRLLAAVTAVSLAAAPAAYAVNAAWNTNAVTGDFNTAQWTSGTTTPAAGGTYTVLSGDALFFGTSTSTTLNNNLTGATYNGLTFNTGASAFTIGGNSFTLNGNITNSSASLQTINNNMTSTAGRVFTGGTGGLTLGGTFTTAVAATYAGTVNLTGATTVSQSGANNQGFVTIGAGTNSTVTLSNGGSLAINGTTAGTKPNSIVANNVSTSALNVGAGDQSSSGTLTVGAETGFVLGNNNTSANGTLNVNSGTATITRGSTTATDIRSFVSLGRDTGTGTINLNGGTLATGRNFIRDGSATADTLGAANFNFNGGTLQALANQTDWLNSSTKNTNQLALTSVTTTSAASTIDSNGFSVAINNVISGAGGFNINSSTGTGTVTFGGANTYTGATKVNSGIFALGATGSISNSSGIEIATGAIFNTTAQSFTMSGSQTVTFDLDGDGAGSAGLFQAAALNIGAGSVSFNLTGGALDDAAYILANYTSISGTAFATVNNLPTGYALDYNYLGGNQIALVAIPEPSTFAALAGLVGLGLAASRRRRAAAPSL